MRHQFQNQWEPGGPREFFEKAYRRGSLAVWDARWQGLSVAARRFFLDVVKLPDRNRATFSDPPFVARDKFPPHILEELVTAGFVKIPRVGFPTGIERVLAGDGIDDFAWRTRVSSPASLAGCGSTA